MKQKIKQLINDPEKGLISDLNKLQGMLKDNGVNVTLEKIKEVRDEQNWHQLTQIPKKQKEFNNHCSIKWFFVLYGYYGV